MFFNKKEGLVPSKKFGRVYVFKITLDDGTELHKVGMCYSDRALDRMMEVLRSFFHVYRYVPRCEIRRDKKLHVPRLVEKHMHELLEDWSYHFDKSFGGSTEFFQDLDEDILLDYLDNFTYNLLLAGRTSINEKELQDIRQVITATEPKKPKKSDIIPF